MKLNFMKQAQELQKRMEEMQQELDHLEVDGQSGGGLVQVVVNGKGDMKKITIDPSLLQVDEKDILEDLIVAAISDARHKANDKANAEMAKITGSMKLPF